MKHRKVSYAAEAESDLGAIYFWMAERAGASVASRYVGRLQDFCEGLDIASERGMLRPELMPGLRTVGFEGRLTIAFLVEDSVVQILRVFAAGRNWEATFEERSDN